MPGVDGYCELCFGALTMRGGIAFVDYGYGDGETAECPGDDSWLDTNPTPRRCGNDCKNPKGFCW